MQLMIDSHISIHTKLAIRGNNFLSFYGLSESKVGILHAACPLASIAKTLGGGGEPPFM